MMRIVFWGTGNRAKEYMAQIKELSDWVKIVAFTDGNQEERKTKDFWNGYHLISPKMIQESDIDYICILSIWEWEIRQKIYDDKLFDLSKIISFHEIYLMDSLGMDLDSCYRIILKGMHPLQREWAKEWSVYEDLKKNYSYVLCDSSYWNRNTDRKACFRTGVRPVWILWLQGLEQAPELVKVCVHSIQRALGEKEVICLLDANNLFDYIDLPDYIVEKWQKGIIDNTHFSDLIRLRLLNQYGGVWIDATVYFTGNRIPDYIKDSQLFMFSIWRDWRARQEPAISANWLIAAQAENQLLMILEALHHEYWKNEDSLCHYIIFHILWTITVERFPDEWNQVETVLRDPARLLSKELNCEFNSERFEQLKRISDIHKLSYKIPYTEGGKESFWGKICELESGV